MSQATEHTGEGRSVTLFLVLGGIGLVVLAAAVVLDGVTDALDVLDVGGWLSAAAVGGFLAAFGFGGALSLGPLGTAGAVGVGAAAGLAAGAAAGLLTRHLTRMPTDATPRAADLAGVEATVLTGIAGGGYGEVWIRTGGQRVKLNARSDRPVAAGARVWVAEVLSPTAVRVVPVDEIDSPPSP
jgi:hypothetical protein